MKKTSKLFIILLVLSILILGTGLVSAADLTSTNERIDNATKRVDWALERADNATERVNTILENYDSSSASSFADLQSEINNGVRNFTKDYKYVSGSSITISLSNTVLDFNGHILDCSGSTNFKVTGNSLTIKNAIIINGRMNSYNLGCLEWDGASGTLTDCVFVNCYGNGNAGALHWFGTYGTLSDCVFINCTATNGGGAIYWNDKASNCNLAGDCVFINCVGPWGGAVIFRGTNCFVTGDCVFINCSARESGGGLKWDGASGTLTGDCVFVNCSANIGGGLNLASNNANFKSASTFINCSATSGSAIYWNTNSLLDLGNLTFIDNKASASLSVLANSKFLYTATLTGGNNILNAVYATNIVNINNIKVNGTVIANAPTTSNVYRSDFLYNQPVNITVYGDNNSVLDSVVAYTDLNGTVRYYALNGTKINFTHFESSLYRYASASTPVTANVSISASIDDNITVLDKGVLNVTIAVKGVSYSFGGNITVNSSFLNTTLKYTGSHLIIPFTAPFVGVYPINITYVDSEININTTLNLTTIGWNPEVFAYVNDIVYGESLNISLNTLISNVTGKVQYYDLNGNLINTTSINEGFTYTPSTTGLHIVKMVYSGDNYYRTEIVYRSFMVYMFRTNISANSSVINLGESFVISPNITSGATGNVLINGRSFPIGSNYTFTPSKSGVYNISIKYNGDGLFSPANTTVQVTVCDVFLNATVNSTNLTFGESVLLNTSVFNNESDLITKGKVSFIFDDGTSLNVTRPGETLTYTPKSTGVHTVLVIYDGEDFNLGRNTILTLNVFEVPLVSVSLNSTVNSTSILYNESVLLNTTVLNGTNLVSVGNLTYVFDDGTESVITSPEKTITYTPKSTGNHTIIIRYSDESGVYNSNYTVLYVYVNKLNTTLTAINGSILVNESYIFTPNLTSGASGFIFVDGLRLSIGENYTFKPSGAGNFTLSLIYDGDEYFNPSNTTVFIEVNDTTPISLNLTLTINSTSILYNESVLLNTSLMDSDGNLIAVGSVSFIFDDGSISKVTSPGETLVYTPRSTGNRTIIVEYSDASGVYADNLSVLYLFVNKLNTTVTAFNGSILLEDSFIISPNVTSGASGSIVVNGATIPVGGSYTFTPHEAGNYTILIEYTGDEYYNPSTTTIIVEVNETSIIPVFLNATLNSTSIFIRDSVLVNLTVLDNESNRVTSGFVSFLSDDGLIDTTVPLGESIQYTPKVAGVHTIILTYEGNGIYESRVAVLTLNVLKLSPNLTASALDILYGESTNLSLNSTSTGISGTVNYYNENHDLIASSSINEGITYTPDSTGLCTVIMEYSGDEYYGASTVYISFNVSKLNSTVSVENTSILDNESYTFTPTVTMGASGSLLINGLTIPVGASYTFTPTKVGNYTIVVTYLGDEYYNSANTTVFIEVNDTTPLNVDLEVSINSTSILYNESVLLNTSLNLENKGTVTFIFDDGTTVVKNIGETYQYAPNTVGNHTIIVEYSDSSNTYANTSKVLYLYVNKLNSTVSVSNASILDNESYTFTPTVTPGASGFVFIDGVRLSIGESYTFTPTKAGNYTLTVLYDGDDYYVSSNTTVFIEVNDTTPLNVNLDVSTNSSSILYNESVLLNASVIDSEGKLVTIGSLIYHFDDGFNVSALINEPISYKPNSIGTHIVNVEYIDSTGRYVNTSKTISIVVNKLNSTVTALDGVINFTDSYTFTPTVTPGASGYVFIDGVRFSIGESYTFKAKALGNFTLTIQYGGDDYYNPSNTTVSILVLDNSPLNVNLDVNSNSTNILYGDSVLLNTNVLVNGENIDTGSLIYHFDDGSNKTALINEPISYKPNSIGTHTVIVEYIDSTGKYVNTSKTINIVVNKLNSTVTVIGATISLDETFDIAPNVTEGATGYIFVDGVRISVNGTYTFIPTRTGTYIFNVEYTGDNIFNPSNTTVRIIVVNIELINVTLNTTLNTSSISYNESLSLDVTVIGDDGEIITTGNLTYSFDDGTESITLPIGETLNYTPQAPGIHSINVYYSGSNTYNWELTSVSVIVNKLNSTIIASDMSVFIGEYCIIHPVLTPGATGNLIVNGISIPVGETYTFISSTPGNYSISISYQGDSIYNPTNTTINVIVIDNSPRNVSLTGFINSSLISIGESVLLNTTVLDNESNLVSTGSLTYIFDDSNPVTVTVGETVTYTPKFSGNHSILVIYTDSTGVYETNNTNLNVDVIKLNSNITADNANITIGEVYIIRPNLTEGASGTLVVNGVNIPVGGTYTFIPTEIGTYNISIQYLGDNVYEPSDAIVTIIVLDDALKDVSINLSSNTTTITIGDEVLLNASVFDNESNLITVGILTYIFDNGENITVPVGEEVLYTPESTGNHSIIVVYSDSTGVYNTNTTSLNLELIKLNTTVSANNATILINETYTITPIVTSGATGTLIVNGVSIQVGGSYTFIPTSPGIYNLNIQYLGDSIFNPSNTTVEIIVLGNLLNNITIRVYSNSSSLIIGESVLLNTSVFDNESNPITSGSLTYLFDDGTESETVQVGDSIIYTPKFTGNHSINVVYTESLNLFNTLNTFKPLSLLLGTPRLADTLSTGVVYEESLSASNTGSISIGVDVTKLNSTIEANDSIINLTESYIITPILTPNATGTLIVNGVSIQVGESYTFTPSSTGTYTISIQYLGDSKFNPSNTTITVTVLAIETIGEDVSISPSINKDIVLVNDNVSLNAVVFDSTGIPINKGILTYIFDDGRNITVQIGETITYTPETSGNHSISIVYTDSTGTYKTSITSLNLEVSKLNSTVSANDSIINLTESYTFTPVVSSNATGTILVNGVSIQVGESYTFKASTPGTYNISIQYLGDSVFNPSNTTITVIVEEVGANLINTSISASDLEISYNETVFLNLTVLDTDGNLVNTGSLTYLFDDGSEETVNIGEILEYNFTSTGNHTVIIRYSDDSGIYRESSTSFNILVNKLNSTITANNGTINLTESYTITLELTPGASGTVRVNGVNINGGSYTFTPTSPGIYNISIEYEGDNIFNPSNTTITITVLEIKTPELISTNINISDIEISYFDLGMLNATVFDSEGNPITVGILTYLFDDGTVSRVPVGTSTIYNPSSTGNHTVVVRYTDEEGVYNTSVSTFNILVNKVNSTVMGVNGNVNLGESYIITPVVSEGATGTIRVNNVNIDVGSSYTFTSTVPGVYEINIEYLGDNIFNPSNTTVTVIVVDNRPKDTSIDTSNITNLTVYNTTLSFNLSVYCNDSSVIIGNLTYVFDDGTTFNVSIGEVVEYAFTSTGNHSVSVFYSDTNGLYKSSSASFSIFVNKLSSSISAVGSSIILGESYTFTPQVTSGATGTLIVNGVSIPVGANYTFTSSSAGLFNISIGYLGDDVYTPSNTTISVLVLDGSKVIGNLNISTNTSSIIYNETVLLNASIFDNISSSYVKGLVTYIFDDGTPDLTCNTSDLIPYTPKSAGNHTIIVRYSGSDVYEALTSNITISVSKIPTTLSANGGTVSIGGSLDISPVLTPGATGIIFVNDVSIRVGGTYQFIGTSTGTYTLTVIYPGDEYYAPSSTTVTVTVTGASPSPTPISKKDTSLTVTPVDGALDVSLTDSTGSSIANKPVTVFTPTKTLNYITDSSGEFKISYDDLDEGEYNIVLEYYGDENTNPTSTLYSVNIPSDLKKNTTMNINPKDDSLEIILTDTDGALANQTINITLNDETSEYALNGEGKVSIDLNDLEAGEYTLIVSYSGDNTRNPATKTYTFIIPDVSNGTCLEANFNGTLTYGDRNALVGKLSTYSAVALAGHHVAINVSRLSNGQSKVYWVTVDYNGNFILPINLAPGQYSLEAIYYGEQGQEANRTGIMYFNITESKINTILTVNEYRDVGGKYLTGKLSTNTGLGVSNQVVSIELSKNSRSKVYTVVTNGDGVFSLAINLVSGVYGVKCSYSGTDFYLRSEDSATMTIL